MYKNKLVELEKDEKSNMRFFLAGGITEQSATSMNHPAKHSFIHFIPKY